MTRLLFFLSIGTASAVAAAAPKCSELEGLYFLGGDRTLLIHEGRYLLTLHDRSAWLEGPGGFSPRISPPDRGYRDCSSGTFGIQDIDDTQHGCNFAVLNGRLWLGVMLKWDPEGRSEGFSGSVCGPLVIPQRAPQMPAADLRVDFEVTTGKWNFWSQGKTLRADRTLAAGDLRLPLVSREGDGGTSLENFGPVSFSDTFGVASQLAYQPTDPLKLPTGKEAEKQWLTTLRSDHGLGYRLKGTHVMLTPWSVDLGPVGLKPLPDTQAFGTWASERDPKLRVVMPMPPDSTPPHTAGDFFRPQPIKNQLASHNWTPNRWGTSLQHLACPHPPVSHHDGPIRVLWTLLDKDRAMRFTSTENWACCFRTKKPVGDLEFFRRASEPN